MLRSGTAVVGPVSTDLLLKGLASGRVPRTAGIRQVGWAGFRRLNQIREVNAWERSRAAESSEPRGDAGVDRAIERAIDRAELLLLTLGAAVSNSHAHLGLAYRVRPPLNRPVISCVCGAGVQLLGQVLHDDDPAFSAASQHEFVLGRPCDGAVERAIERRLTDQALGGVALVPILANDILFGVVELGRFDHPFRQTDRERLERIALAAEMNVRKVDNRVRSRAARQLIRFVSG